jgi:hypothetical protein
MRQALAMLVVSLLGVALVGAAFAAPTTTESISSNWSGYAAIGLSSSGATADPSMSFTDVTGTWTQPTATCTPGRSTSAAFWVGLGGYSDTSQALEQTGTEVDCNLDGTASYFAWYELVPANSVPLKLKISPGDVITASVVVNGSSVLVQLKDRTRHTSFTKRLTMSSPAPDLTSAEWIAESPDLCDRLNRCVSATLTNFGSVTFSKIAAIGNAQPGRLSAAGWQSTPISLVPEARHARFFGGGTHASGARAGATSAAPAADGSSFTVNWLADASSLAAST